MSRPALFTDESVYGPTVALLRLDGWDIQRAVDFCSGAPDQVVLAEAFARQRLLVTEDFDFGELVVRFGLEAHGLITIALADIADKLKPPIVNSAMSEHEQRLRGTLTVIEATRVRMRPIDDFDRDFS